MIQNNNSPKSENNNSSKLQTSNSSKLRNNNSPKSENNNSPKHKNSLERILGVKKFLGATLLSAALIFTAPTSAKAQSNMSKMGAYLKNNLGYIVHGTAVQDTVRLDLYDVGTGLSVRIIPEIYISKSDASSRNSSIKNSFSITFAVQDSSNKYASLITSLQGNVNTYNVQRTPEQNALKLDSTLQGIVTAINNSPLSTPKTFGLHQNYPNPFNPETKITYILEDKSEVDLTVYNLLGRAIEHLAHCVQNPGTYEVRFACKDNASGVYFYRLEAKPENGKQPYIQTKKMILEK